MCCFVSFIAVVGERLWLNSLCFGLHGSVACFTCGRKTVKTDFFCFFVLKIEFLLGFFFVYSLKNLKLQLAQGRLIVPL